MLQRIDYLHRRLETSFWFIPGLSCVASLIVGVVMLWLDRHVTNLFTGWQVFAMPVSSAREVLSVIAGSVISVGGVSFSVTMVALTLTSGQYGPKVLRHFLEDNASKVSLGLFLGAYVYALVVLTGYVDTDKPHLSVLTGLVLALLAIVGFVRFIHTIATDLQADEIVQRIGTRLCRALHALTEAAEGERRSHDLLAWRRHARGHTAHVVAHRYHGYVETVDYAGLVRWCREHECCVQVRFRAGDFIVEGNGAFKVYGCNADVVEDAIDTLNGFIVTGPIRTAAQDPEFPITQLNQLAARALSPGINDPGTAISCIDWFCFALSRIVDRELPGSVIVDDDGVPRLLVRFTGFAGLLKAVFAPLRQFARTEVSVTISLFEALCRLAELTARRDRLALLGHHGRLIAEGVDETLINDDDLRDIRQRAKRLQILVERLDNTRPAAPRAH